MPNPLDPEELPAELPLAAAPEAAGPAPPERSPESSPQASPFRPDGRELALAPAWITVARLSGLISAGSFSVAAAGALAVAAVVGDSLSWAAAALAWALATLLFAAPALLWPPVAYRHRSYRFEPEGVHLERGVLWRSQLAVPRSRVQHTDVTQGPLERMHGIATLTLHTAGNHYAAVSLPGLEHATALAARDFLLADRAAEAGDAV